MEEKLLNDEELEGATGGNVETVKKYKRMFLDMFLAMPFRHNIQDVENTYKKVMKRYHEECVNMGLSIQEKKEIFNFINDVHSEARKTGTIDAIISKFMFIKE